MDYEVKKKLTLIAIVVGFFLLCLLLYPGHSAKLPEEASNIQDHGNGWSTFELVDKKFLHFKNGSISTTTQIR